MPSRFLMMLSLIIDGALCLVVLQVLRAQRRINARHTARKQRTQELTSVLQVGYLHRRIPSLWLTLHIMTGPCMLMILFIATLLYYRDALQFGMIPYEKDTINYYYPTTHYVWKLIQESNGQIPLWTDKLFGGFPLFADSEVSLFFGDILEFV